MNYGSFYGGRRGASFVIVKSYPDIISMTNEFGRGPNFNEVEFDEYVIINTINKNHPDNGKIFRRGYDYNSGRKISGYRAFWENDGIEYEIIDGIPYDESGNEIEYDSDISIYLNARYQPDIDIDAKGAQYIGTIVGPSGRAPLVEMDTYDSVMQKSAEEGFQIQTSHGDYTFSNDSLMPGKYQENGVPKYNDKIQWFCASLRNDKNDDSIAYIGFKTPYLVIDFLTEQISPYDNQGVYMDASAATRIEDSTTEGHPFYEKWKLSIPNGIQGDSLNNLRIITFDDPTLYNSELNTYTRIYISEDFYYFYNTAEERFLGCSENEGVQIESEGSITINQQNDYITVYPNTKIIVYDRFSYEERKNPTQPEKTYFVGIYNQIKQNGFIIDNYGNIHIDFTDGTSLDKQRFLKIIQNVTFEKNDNNELYMNIIFNTLKQNEEEEEEEQQFDSVSFPIKIIEDITLDDDSVLNISLTDNSTLSFPFKTISNIVTDQNGITINYSTKDNSGVNESVFLPMSWVSDLQLLEDGTVQIRRNNFVNSESWRNLENKLRWITGVNYDSITGNITLNFNNGNPVTYKLKIVDSIGFNEETNSLVVSYNTDTPESVPTQIRLTGKLITKMQYDEDAGQIVVTYTGENNTETFDLGQMPTSFTFNNSNPKGDSILRIKHGEEDILISNPITSIYDMKITPGHHLAVLFNDVNLRNSIESSGKGLTLTSSRDNVSYDGWLDLGSVFVDSGIFIGTNLTYEDLELTAATATIDDVVNELNERLPGGLGGDGDNRDYLKEKIVTVGENNQKKEFYGFDYDYKTDSPEEYKGWYYLGSIESAAAATKSSCRMGSADDQSRQGQEIEVEGLYFLTEEWQEG